MQRYRRAVAAHPGAVLALFVGVLSPLLLFGSLAEDVWAREGFGGDERLLRAVHARATPTLDGLMLFFTRVGAPVPMVGFVALALVLLLLRGRRADALFFALAVGGAATLNVLAKLLFQRARPSLWPSLAPEADYGFPSGHAMGSLAVVAALSILLWRTRWRWTILALGSLFVVAVGLSRVYLGVHYPSDILAGWSASLAWVTGVRLLCSAPWPRWRPRPAGDEARARASATTTVQSERTGGAGRIR